MTIKDIWIGTSNWLRSRKAVGLVDMESELDSEGLLCMDQHTLYNQEEKEETCISTGNLLVNNDPKAKMSNIEQFQEGLNRLTDQLHGINESLGKQVIQHQQLIEHIDNFPGSFSALPDLFDQQKQKVCEMLEQVETQTDTLDRIDHRLAGAGDIETRLVNNIGTMTETLHFINAQSIYQLNNLEEIYKLMFTGQQYVKHVLSVQIKRLTWMWGLSILLGLAATVFFIYTSL